MSPFWQSLRYRDRSNLGFSIVPVWDSLPLCQVWGQCVFWMCWCSRVIRRSTEHWKQIVLTAELADDPWWQKALANPTFGIGSELSCIRCAVHSRLMDGVFENWTKGIPTVQSQELLSAIHAKSICLISPLGDPWLCGYLAFHAPSYVETTEASVLGWLQQIQFFCTLQHNTGTK